MASGLPHHQVECTQDHPDHGTEKGIERYVRTHRETRLERRVNQLNGEIVPTDVLVAFGRQDVGDGARDFGSLFLVFMKNGNLEEAGLVRHLGRDHVGPLLAPLRFAGVKITFVDLETRARNFIEEDRRVNNLTQVVGDTFRRTNGSVRIKTLTRLLDDQETHRRRVLKRTHETERRGEHHRDGGGDSDRLPMPLKNLRDVQSHTSFSILPLFPVERHLDRSFSTVFQHIETNRAPDLGFGDYFS